MKDLKTLKRAPGQTGEPAQGPACPGISASGSRAVQALLGLLLLAALLLGFALCPGSARAAEKVIDMSAVGGDVVIWGDRYEVVGGTLTKYSSSEDTLVLTGTTKQYTVTIVNNIDTPIVLRNLSIDVSSDGHKCAFDVDDNRVTLMLAEGTENTLISGRDCAGIRKGGIESTLTIDAEGDKSGKLTARSGEIGYRGDPNGDAAGIGGNCEDITRGEPGGNVIINGGAVTAISRSGAGIGGVRTVTINGGTVTATSWSGAGIGGGSNGLAGTVTINGGTVKASSLDGAGIGHGVNAKDAAQNPGKVIINGGTVNASGEGGAGIGGGGQTGGCNVIINGGSVKATTQCAEDGAEPIGHGGNWDNDSNLSSGTLKNSAGEDLSLATLTTEGVGAGQTVEALSIAGLKGVDKTSDFAAGEYGMQDVVADETGALSLYLPEEENIFALAAFKDSAGAVSTYSGQAVSDTAAGARAIALSPFDGRLDVTAICGADYNLYLADKSFYIEKEEPRREEQWDTEPYYIYYPHNTGFAYAGDYTLTGSYTAAEGETKIISTVTVLPDYQGGQPGQAGYKTITLDNLTIDESGVDISGLSNNEAYRSPFAVRYYSGLGEYGAAVNLLLAEGSGNKLAASERLPGLWTEGGTKLTIDAAGSKTGSLEALGNKDGAGIGSIECTYPGNITINGGIVTARSATAAGIGSGESGYAEDVTINGGTVTASSQAGAGIGGGKMARGGDVIINGGSVRATTENPTAQAIGHGAGSTKPGTLKNSQGKEVALVTLSTDAGAQKALEALKIYDAYTGVEKTDSFAEGEYGIKDTVTDDEGSLYLYLPKEEDTPIKGDYVLALLKNDTETSLTNGVMDKTADTRGASLGAFEGRVDLSNIGAENHLYLGDSAFYIEKADTEVTEPDAAATAFPYSGNYTLTGGASEAAIKNTVTVLADYQSGAPETHKTITLDNLCIDVRDNPDSCAFMQQPGASTTLILAEDSANQLASGGNRAGLNVAAGSAVVIDAAGKQNGKLEAQCWSVSVDDDGALGAGIGGGAGENGGEITIRSGVVFGYSTGPNGGYGAGIGGSQDHSVEKVTITGGTVHAASNHFGEYAVGAGYGAGIGGGKGGAGGDVVITGGNINTYCGQYPAVGIGHGYVPNGTPTPSSGTLTNGSGAPVYRVIVTAEDSAFKPVFPADTPSPAGYGLSGVQFNVRSQLEFYLPADSPDTNPEAYTTVSLKKGSMDGEALTGDLWVKPDNGANGLIIGKKDEQLQFSDAELTYSGSAQAPALKRGDEKVDFKQIYYKGNEQGSAWGSDNANTMAGGGYGVLAQSKGDTVDGVTYGQKIVSKTYSISPMSLTLKNPKAEKTYDGNTSLSLEGDSRGSLEGVLEADAAGVLLPDTITGTFAAKDVGENIAVTLGDITLSGDKKDNYTLTKPENLTGKITPKELKLTGAAISEKVYDGSTEATVESVSFEGLISGETLTKETDYTAKGEFTENADAGTNKKVTATVTLKEDGAAAKNYTLAQPNTVETTGTITKAEQPALTIKNDDTAYSPDGIALETEGGAGDGLVSWTLDGGTGEGSIEDNTLKVSKCGDFNLKAAKAGDDNYNAAEASKTFTVNKADPAYTVPTDLTAIYGQTLKDITLPADFSWQDSPDTLVGNAGSSTFKATYTPANGDHYNTITDIDITITVGKAEGTASVTMAGWVYGQEPAEPVPASETNGTDQVTYQYATQGGSDYKQDKPSLPGKYTVQATFAATDNYNAVTATADFEITTGSIDGLGFENSQTLYDGQAHSLSVTGEMPKGCTVTYEPASVKDTGTHTIKAIVSGPGYETITLEATLTITPATPGISIEPEAGKDLQVGEPIELTVTVIGVEGEHPKGSVAVLGQDTALDENGEARVVYTPADDKEKEITAVYTPAAGENYTAVEDKTTLTAGKKTREPITIEDLTKTLGDAAFKLEPKGGSLQPGEAYGFKSDNEAVATVDKDGSVTITGVGSAHITVSLPETSGWNPAEAIMTLTVKEKGDTPEPTPTPTPDPTPEPENPYVPEVPKTPEEAAKDINNLPKPEDYDNLTPEEKEQVKEGADKVTEGIENLPPEQQAEIPQKDLEKLDELYEKIYNVIIEADTSALEGHPNHVKPEDIQFFGLGMAAKALGGEVKIVVTQNPAPDGSVLAFSFKLYLKGEGEADYQPAQLITPIDVKILLPEAIGNDGLYVRHLKGDGSEEAHELRIQGRLATFTTDSFSNFLFVKGEMPDPTPTPDPENPYVPEVPKTPEEAVKDINNLPAPEDYDNLTPEEKEQVKEGADKVIEGIQNLPPEQQAEIPREDLEKLDELYEKIYNVIIEVDTSALEGQPGHVKPEDIQFFGVGMAAKALGGEVKIVVTQNPAPDGSVLAFSFKLYLKGEGEADYQPAQLITPIDVKILLPEAIGNDGLYVRHLKGDGSEEAHELRIQGRLATFTTDSFSNFLFVKGEMPDPTPTPTPEPTPGPTVEPESGTTTGQGTVLPSGDSGNNGEQTNTPTGLQSTGVQATAAVILTLLALGGLAAWKKKQL